MDSGKNNVQKQGSGISIKEALSIHIGACIICLIWICIYLFIIPSLIYLIGMIAILVITIRAITLDLINKHRNSRLLSPSIDVKFTFLNKSKAYFCFSIVSFIIFILWLMPSIDVVFNSVFFLFLGIFFLYSSIAFLALSIRYKRKKSADT